MRLLLTVSRVVHTRLTWSRVVALTVRSVAGSSGGQSQAAGSGLPVTPRREEAPQTGGSTGEETPLLAPRLAGEETRLSGSTELVRRLAGQVELRSGFLTEEEEAAMIQELEPVLRRKRYEFDHWDDAIHGYRETERARWGAASLAVLERVRAVAFPAGSPLLGPVHVLDLDKAGYIKPHIDSVKYCGSTIAGLSLLSDSVMRLVKEDDAAQRLDLLLPRRSLYILRDQARYEFTHEILRDQESVFNGQRVPRLRRISVICRNLNPS